jgi:hypothetical protein
MPVGRWVSRTAESVLLTLAAGALGAERVRGSRPSEPISTCRVDLRQDLDEGERRLRRHVVGLIRTDGGRALGLEPAQAERPSTSTVTL